MQLGQVVVGIQKHLGGCETDPDIDCERGEDIKMFGLFIGLIQLVTLHISPLVVIILTQDTKEDDRVMGYASSEGGRTKGSKTNHPRYLLYFWLQTSLALFWVLINCYPGGNYFTIYQLLPPIVSMLLSGSSS